MDEITNRRLVIRSASAWDLLDLPPQFRHYRDEGCELSGCCLECPFPRCLEEVFRGKNRMRRQLRAEEMFALHTSGQRNIAQLASLFGVSRDTVSRSLMSVEREPAEPTGTPKQGLLQSFNKTDYLATVELAGSHAAYLEDLSVARNIPAVEMVAGRKVVIVFFDDHNAKDSVIIAVYT